MSSSIDTSNVTDAHRDVRLGICLGQECPYGAQQAEAQGVRTQDGNQ
jgi:hypothetical protein